MRWHRANEGATLYSVLNAWRAWRYALDDVLGSKLDGAAWTSMRWPDTEVIAAAVDLRHGRARRSSRIALAALLDHDLLTVDADCHLRRSSVDGATWLPSSDG